MAEAIRLSKMMAEQTPASPSGTEMTEAMRISEEEAKMLVLLQSTSTDAQEYMPYPVRS